MHQKSNFFLLLLIISVGSFSSYGAIPEHASANKDFDIKLPAEIRGKYFNDLSVHSVTNSDSWADFKSKFGNWTILFDKHTDTPHRAFGEPIRIDGFTNINENNIEAAAYAFVNQYKRYLGVDPNNLKLVRTDHVNQRFYVTFVQIYKGIEVLNSELELRIFENGNIPAFGCDYFKDINIETKASIRASNLAEYSTVDLPVENRPSASIVNIPEIFILPLRNDESIEYRLIYIVNMEGEQEYNSFMAYVDAHSGEILKREKTLHAVDTEISVDAMVKIDNPEEKEVKTQLPNVFVNIDKTQLVTDKNGKAHHDVVAKQNIKVRLAGKYVEIMRDNDAKVEFTSTIEPGKNVKVFFDESNSHISERIMYYATNVAHDYIKSIDPKFTKLDKPVKVTIKKEGLGPDKKPNAGSTSSGDILFFGADDKKVRISQSAGVLYHEYGHSITTMLYGGDHPLNHGLQNKASHEAFADLFCASITKRPEIGLGIYADDPTGKWIRNIKNNNIYPDSLIGESHHDSKILSGAYWDLKELVKDDAWWNRIIHFVKYSKTDDPNDGKVFMEWFIETLIADDDDGNLVNGTPHSKEIISAFNKHHIGTNLLLKTSFEHTSLVDTKEISNDYPVEFKINGNAQLGLVAKKLKLIYRINGQKKENIIHPKQKAAGNANEYIANIPTQKKGTFVEYYFKSEENLAGEEITFKDEYGKNYMFLVGFDRFFSDNFETDKGWKVRGDGDNATRGMWEKGIPQEKMRYGPPNYPMQIEEDHSEQGTQCFTTGPKVKKYYEHETTLNGQTSLISPVIDISSYKNPMLSFYQWFFNEIQYGYDNKDNYVYYVSSDAGKSWKRVTEYVKGLTKWYRSLISIENYVEKTKEFRFKIVVQTKFNSQNLMQTLTNLMIDDVEIFGIETSSVNEKINRMFSLYPNPVSDNKLNLQFSTQLHSDTYVRIVDQLGKLVSDYTIDTQSGRQNISLTIPYGIANGCYFVEVTTNNNTFTQKLIIK